MLYKSTYHSVALASAVALTSVRSERRTGLDNRGAGCGREDLGPRTVCRHVLY